MSRELRATYRLQLRPELGFDDARRVLPYLDALGVSHLYTSPSLQAARGSTHGYDVVDPTHVRDELGGEEGHRRLVADLRERNLGLVLDIVPNHMAIPGRENPWWWDVLENGPSSRYARFFDVDWDPPEARLQNKVLLPVLGDQYGRVLEARELSLEYDDGAFVIRYYERAFPVDPGTLEPVLAAVAHRSGSDLCAFLAGASQRLPRSTATEPAAAERRHRDKAVLADLIGRMVREDPEVASALEAEVARMNQDVDVLDALLEEQNYRLAFWRAAGRDLGYRRFFDIATLIGLRVEDPVVFEASHDLVARWVQDGVVDGLRVDHPDGLRDPAGYFDRLAAACPGTWTVSEKILEPGENLPRDWKVAGTTGYDFLARVLGVLIDPHGLGPLGALFDDIVGEPIVYEDLVRDCKRQVLTELLGSELNRLAALFLEACEGRRRHRDHSRHELHEVLREVAACFPVYRSYVRPAGRASTDSVSEEDVRYVQAAVERAKSERDDLDPELFELLERILLLREPGERQAELAVRFQQLTGPAMAKGVEDTAFYRYHRLAAACEVGADPGAPAVSVEAFHAACRRTAHDWPRAMLATSTHDTKRSEDVRARLALLSEIPDRWREAVARWSARDARLVRDGAPDPSLRYLLYQTMVGAWPLERERLVEYAQKAAREAKMHTAWTHIDEAYETALEAFISGVYDDRERLADLEAFVAPLVEPGRINALAQTLVKLTTPGVPDIYQGCEVWDLSLVDPDNRRPVDFARRETLLTELMRAHAERVDVEAILARTEEGAPKMWVIHRALELRRARPHAFREDYVPLEVEGSASDHVLAFARGDEIITIVPRLGLRFAREHGGDWGDTALTLPAGDYDNCLTGECLTGEPLSVARTRGGAVRVADVLSRFPVALLARRGGR